MCSWSDGMDKPWYDLILVELANGWLKPVVGTVVARDALVSNPETVIMIALVWSQRLWMHFDTRATMVHGPVCVDGFIQDDVASLMH